MEIELTKEYKQLADIVICANGTTLNNIHIKDDIAEVSDGFMLAQKPIDYKGDELLLDAETIKKQKKYPIHCIIEQDKIISDDGKFIIDNKHERYPDTQILYPQDGIKSKITLSKDKLLRFLKCFDEDDAIVEISIYGDSKPVELEVTNLDDKFYGQGLIMPIIKRKGGK